MWSREQDHGRRSPELWHEITLLAIPTHSTVCWKSRGGINDFP
jgi:hypothetical protein